MSAPEHSSLKRLHAGYQQLFEQYPVPMVVVNLATLALMAANEAAARCYGYSVAQLLEMHLPDLYFDEDQGNVPAYMALAPKDRAQQRLWRHKGRDGQTIAVELDSEDMQLHGFATRMLVIRDVTPKAAVSSADQRPKEQLPGTVQRIGDGMLTLDSGARLIALNASAHELFGMPGDVLLGKTLWQCCAQMAHAKYRAIFESVTLQKQAVRFEIFHGLRQAWLEVRAFPCAQGTTVFFRDVTEQRRTNELMMQEHERLNAIVEASSEAIISVDAAGRVQSFNPGAEKVFGVSSKNLLGKSATLLVPQRYRGIHSPQPWIFADGAAATRAMEPSRIKGLCADGREIDLEGHITQVSIGHEKVLIATLRDVTARNLADAERQHNRAQLSHLARRLMLQEKDLVKRVAQALHDQLGQTMAAIRVVHETMGVLRKGRGSREYLRLNAQLEKLIDQANRQVRMVLGDLHPALLDEQGLGAALDNELRGRSLRQKAMNFVLNVPSQVLEMRWPSAVEYGAFMIAREAIENALRHAKATQVTVNLRGTPDAVELDVLDNGEGFAPDSLVKPGRLGVTGMLERAYSFGATVSLGRAEPTGTQVCIRWKQGP